MADLSANVGHNLLLMENGEVLNFGDGRYGRLGHGNNLDVLVLKLIQVCSHVFQGAADLQQTPLLRH